MNNIDEIELSALQHLILYEYRHNAGLSFIDAIIYVINQRKIIPIDEFLKYTTFNLTKVEKEQIKLLSI